MAKFRKKPVVIEAEQFIATRQKPPFFYEGNPVQLIQGEPHVQTLEGQLRVSDGDWIIRGVKGEFYPCKPDIFAATYETVEEPQAVDAVVTPVPLTTTA